MLGYVARRILLAIPIAFGVSVVCFSLVYLAPGDPLQTILPSDATADMVEQIKHAYGFDRPLPLQYLFWLGHVLTGDFGASIATRRPVILEVTGALSNTFMLTSLAVPLAFISATRWAPSQAAFPDAQRTASSPAAPSSASACPTTGSASSWSSSSRSN
jgi:peptide/nickel transport system permease protein